MGAASTVWAPASPATPLAKHEEWSSAPLSSVFLVLPTSIRSEPFHLFPFLSLPRRCRRSSALSPPLPTPPLPVASLDAVAAATAPSCKSPHHHRGCVCAVGEESRIICFGGCSEALIDSSVVAFVQFHEYCYTTK
jgi:hypothetical protein